MTSFTSGPWVSMKISGRHDYVVLRKVGNDHAAGPAFAYVSGEDVGVATAKANARLIAAAPDLLAACKAMAEWVNQRPDTHPVDAWRMCEAAIAKAEGRTDG